MLARADAILAEQGLDGFSIPALAESLGYSRRSIYMFFPTPYAVLNELARRYVSRLQGHLEPALKEVGRLSVEWLAAKISFEAASFLNGAPVARLLILGGVSTSRNFCGQEISNRHLGRLAERILTAYGYQIPNAQPDRAATAIELGTACFRLSYTSYGHITEPYVVESAYVMLLYLRDILELEEMPGRHELSVIIKEFASATAPGRDANLRVAQAST
nr:TetR/AcrR family transcriptional regulator [Oceanococcus sp. HetDA_MAG_MS8]